MRVRVTEIRSYGLLLIFLLGITGLGHAQSTYGSLAGSATDTSGSSIPGARVTLTNTATSAAQTQVTSGEGYYSFVNLAPGQYELLVEKEGFRRVSQKNVVIQVQQATRVDVSLPVGQIDQTVTVTAETPLLQAETSSLGQVVEQRSANELPLNGRNVFNLVALAPSVVMQGGAAGTATGQNPFSWGNFQIGGAFANQSAEYLDGQPLNIGYINLPVLIPTQDSIGEFKVQTHDLGPEWGKLAGGVLNLSTKSGSNAWHGEAYEYIRNKVLNANTWFSNHSDLARPAFTQNQFGGNFGGAIIKDKTFFFFGYEGFRLSQGETFTETVPTLAVRNAVAAGNDVDLTAMAAASSVTSVVDPCGSAPPCIANYNGSFGSTSTGVLVPAARINPTTKALLPLVWPAPVGTNASGAVNNYTVNDAVGGRQNQFVGRLDQALGEKQHLFGRISQWTNLNSPVDPLGTGLCLDRCVETYSTYALAIGYNYIINPTTIANLNVSGSRFSYNRTPKNSGFDFTSIGWPSGFNAELGASLRTPPTPCVTGIASDITCGQGQSVIVDRDTQYNFSPDITLIRGRHTIQVGGQWEISLDNYTQTNTASGAFAFTGNYTNLSFADYLLGWANNPGTANGNHYFGSAQIANYVAAKQNYWALYANDTVHATKKLAVNLGLRYEFQSPWTERHDRQSYFDPTGVDPVSTAAFGSSVLGKIDLVATPGVRSSRYNLNPKWTDFSPRVGFAYSLDDKTVIRGGYGIFWIPLDTAWSTNPLNDPVNSIQTQYSGNNGAVNPNSQTLVPTNTISTPWPKFIQPPGRDPSYAADLLGQGISVIATPQYKYGYTQQWTLDIQRTLPGGWFADIAYAGTNGTHLPQFTQQIDQLANGYFTQAAAQAASNQAVAIAQQVTNPLAAAASPGSPLSSPTISAGQLLRPYPQYAGLQIAGQGSFASSYDSLQASVQKRFDKGGTLLASYTWSKLLSNTDSITSWLENGGIGGIQDWNNLGSEWSLSSNDVPQNLVISYVLDLPIGHGKTYLGSLPPVAEKVVGGWGVDGNTSLRSGFPVNINAAANPYLGNFGVGTLRPDVVPSVRKATTGSADSRVENGWINAAAFSQPAAYTFGNESRVDSSLRTQGIANFDFALFKNTTFGPNEKLGFQFRTEFFNLFNHPEFGPPGNSYGASNFGIVSTQVNNPRLVQFAAKVLF
jgi:hypothetical protein